MLFANKPFLNQRCLTVVLAALPLLNAPLLSGCLQEPERSVSGEGTPGETGENPDAGEPTVIPVAPEGTGGTAEPVDPAVDPFGPDGSGGAPGAGTGGGAEPGGGTGGMVGNVGGSMGGAMPSSGTGGMVASPHVEIFDEARVHDIQLTMSPQDWQSIIDDSRGDEWRHASFSYDGVTIDNIGVRPSGESSRFAGNVKMSVKLKFDAFTGTGKFGGLEELKLSGMWDDPSFIRDRLAYFVYRAFMPAPREVHGKLMVNGQPRGVYAVEEVWDDEAIKRHFPAPNGPLYRIRGEPGMDPYLFRGPEPALYVPIPWDAKGNRPMVDHTVIGAYLKVLGEAPASLEQVVDMEHLMAFFAVSAVVTNIDGFNGNFQVEDHFQYYNPATGKFSILPWDPDNTFGSINDPADRSIYARFSKSLLTTAIRDTPAFRARYKAKLAEVMGKISIATLHAEADRIYQQIKPAVYEDPLKLSTSGHFDFSLQYIKEFSTSRYANIQEQVTHGP